MREAVCFSVVLNSIWVGEYNTINQHNCKKNGTTAKQNTTAKKMAQLQNCTQESYKKLAQLQKNGTTAKQNFQLQKKAQLQNTFIAVVHFWQ